jgi:hypothetical protein
LWTRRIGIAGAITTVNAIEYEPTFNNIYISGKTTGNIGGIIAGQEDMFVAKYDINGTQPLNNPNYWTRLQGITGATVNCSGQGCTSSVVFDSNGTMYSFTDTNGTFPGLTNPSSPNRSMFLVRNVQ